MKTDVPHMREKRHVVRLTGSIAEKNQPKIETVKGSPQY